MAVPHVSMVRTERPTPPEPTDRPPRSWRAIHRRAIPLTRRCNNHLAAAGTASHNHHVGGSGWLPRLWFETDGRTDSATASTVPSPTVSIDARAHMIASSKNISLSTMNGIGRSVNLKGIIVAFRVGVVWVLRISLSISLCQQSYLGHALALLPQALDGATDAQ